MASKACVRLKSNALAWERLEGKASIAARKRSSDDGVGSEDDADAVG